jgi:Mn-dependent DtxR family transcriptional regulator
MKKLRESGYITMAADGTITLNESGLEIAKRVYSRHRAVTRLFTLLGVSEEQAAEDACKVEHDLSDETYACICAFIAKQDGE